jgi:hypothetical protein
MTEPVQKLFPSRSDSYPQESDADIAYNTGKAALSSVPIIGGVMAEVLSNFLSPPISKRRDSWFKDFAEDFTLLEERVKGFKLGELQNNEVFVSSVIQATKIALATHSRYKRRLLRNALMNIATKETVSEDQQYIFLQLVEKFTPSHVRVLSFLRSPHEQLRGKLDDTILKLGIGADLGIQKMFPELVGKDDLVKNLLLDLYNGGLTTSWSVDTGLPARPLTNTGMSFLDFVTISPLGGIEDELS